MSSFVTDQTIVHIGCFATGHARKPKYINNKPCTHETFGMEEILAPEILLGAIEGEESVHVVGYFLARDEAEQLLRGPTFGEATSFGEQIGLHLLNNGIREYRVIENRDMSPGFTNIGTLGTYEEGIRSAFMETVFGLEVIS